MSYNSTIACASCHKQEDGFSDTATFSEGFLGEFTGRNSMGLANARFYELGSFFWDQRAETLEDQVLMPIQDHVEMGMSLDTLVLKLDGLEYYDPLFEDVFGDAAVTTDRISLALSQFIRSMVSYNAKFDEGMQTIGQANFETKNLMLSANRDLWESDNSEIYATFGIGKGEHYNDTAYLVVSGTTVEYANPLTTDVTTDRDTKPQ